ncbi:MAG: phosphatidate cytidylyltransferase [Myxococcota bacterium]
MTDLAKRFLTAGVLIPLVLAAIFWGGSLGVWAVTYAVTLASLDEFLRMMLPAQARLERWVGFALGAIFAASLYWSRDAEASLAWLAGTVVALFTLHLGQKRDLQLVGARVGVTLLGVLYVGLLLTPVALLGRRADASGWLVLALSLTFLGDTGAYFAGRALGRHKLLPEVSPKKTVEGALGGLCAAIGATVVAKLWYMPELAWRDCLLLAVPAGALAQLGDLCESMIKRGAGVKDSGWILPGHGGMLDRIDGLLFSAPYVYLYSRWLYPA